ncbi:MAG: glucoamylase family protein [Burkholderiaceae bacterium]
MLLAGLWAAGTPTPWLAALLCGVWAASPVWTWLVSRVQPVGRDAALAAPDAAYLQGMARDTWRLFERCVGPQDNHLPPDNLQLTPHSMVAHRTSPTNIGLYLLATACARRFGWIGTEDMLARLEASFETLATLTRYRGHFLNWYDTHSRAALTPMYVSTVDSGNLSGHLLALAQACLELAQAPYDPTAARGAVAASLQRIEALRLRGDAARPDAALSHLLTLPDPLAQCRERPDAMAALLADVETERAAAAPAGDVTAVSGMPQDDADTPLDWLISDHVSLLRSAMRDAQAERATLGASPPQQDRAQRRLEALAETCQQFAWEADFAFLYHRKRHLFHIGYRVAEQELDASFYDLLASESRLTSLLAIAKGDAPVSHWSALGRPFYAVGALAGLRSWSGSMFEYLMPSLVLDEPHGSVLHDACKSALREQIRFGRERDVPWGLSESAVAASDHTLAYQYGPQGVPRLALRRTPADELVVAPYATALAAQIAPHRAVENLVRLEALAARRRLGFIEALDYTPVRQTDAAGVARVDTFMAHHQGMTIVALANVLLDGTPQRWGMADPHIEAVSSLLHERAPREVPVLLEPPPQPSRVNKERRGAGLMREILPGMAALTPTHLLSNGRYSVALRANGAGSSRWNKSLITRTRDDLLRDAHGSFFHLRWDRQPNAVSLTQHPAPDPRAHYQCSYHADRVCFDATWPELASRITVWVSPEDDIEFRQIELRNLGERALDLELMSSFEVTLAAPGADEAHPAFSNLFVRAQWRAAHRALVFERAPRLADERSVFAAHFLAEGWDDPQLRSIGIQSDRLRWLGRNHDTSRPLAAFDVAPGQDAVLDTGLDPVCAMSLRLQLGAHSRVRLTLCTAAGDEASTLAALIDKYSQRGPIERASLMSATLAGIRLRELRMSAENLTAIQALTTVLLMTATRPSGTVRPAGSTPAAAAPPSDRRALWRFGISGDLPIVLVFANAEQDLGLLRALARALRVWSLGGVACDLVVVDAEPASYLMPLQHGIAALRERHLADSAAQPGPAQASFHVLRMGALSAPELITLKALARVRLNADGRPLVHHVQDWLDQHDEALGKRDAISRSTVPVAPGATTRVPQGRFAAHNGEFAFDVNAFQRPARPWVNVIANPEFGTQLSEAGGGYTWAVNSRLNQLTPWSNDPVADPQGEWLLLQDLRTLQTWSIAASAWGDGATVYSVTHGQGYSRIGHRCGDLDVEAVWCVDTQSAVKQLHVKLVNRGRRTLRLRVINFVEWIMGAGRGDRASVDTASFVHRLPAAAHDAASESASPSGRQLTALMCTQRDHAAGFGDGTAFLATVTDGDDTPDWTCDRRECFDARGRIVVPDEFSERSGLGLDPCAALALPITLPAGQSSDCVFLLGYGTSREAAQQLAIAAAAVPPPQRLHDARAAWDKLLGATTVQTPDPLFDAMTNRWLLYQTVSCRLWARAGFYQAGGAFGFRDQLQDAMALAWAAPQTLRQQIVLNASRQFAQGDVQHWWHAPTGAGVRTHFSDDLLWLAYACTHYLNCTGDTALLDESVPFIEGAEIPEGAEDAYFVPTVSGERVSVFEHCARAIDRSLRVGAHGLPLMGTGDWNDGMNRVGHEGRGESVWLAWFLCRIVKDFAPIALARGEATRAKAWQDAARGWRAALQGPGWDGQWYRRAFFDDATALGSQQNAECRIDLIAQAWATLSDAAPVAFRRMALAAMDANLVDVDAGLIKLLTPPLQNAQPSAGYIQAYPPGVRENGGQYSHAGVWALMAQARSGNAEAAYRYFTCLSPAHRTEHPTRGPAYGAEPYVMAGDVYSASPYVWRGGWSWYTGSAAWMHRAAIESIFGMRQREGSVSFTPCLPTHWGHAELRLVRDARSLRVVFARPDAQEALADAERSDAVALHPGETVQWESLPRESCCFLLRLDAAPETATETVPLQRLPASSH